MGYILEGCMVRVSKGAARRCPFCGSDDIAVTKREQYEELFSQHGRACTVIECTDCGAEIHYHGLHDDDHSYDHMIEMVMRLWNQRHKKPVKVAV